MCTSTRAREKRSRSGSDSESFGNSKTLSGPGYRKGAPQKTETDGANLIRSLEPTSTFSSLDWSVVRRTLVNICGCPIMIYEPTRIYELWKFCPSPRSFRFVRELKFTPRHVPPPSQRASLPCTSSGQRSPPSRSAQTAVPPRCRIRGRASAVAR